MVGSGPQPSEATQGANKRGKGYGQNFLHARSINQKTIMGEYYASLMGRLNNKVKKNEVNTFCSQNRGSDGKTERIAIRILFYMLLSGLFKS